MVKGLLQLRLAAIRFVPIFQVVLTVPSGFASCHVCIVQWHACSYDVYVKVPVLSTVMACWQEKC